MKKQKYNINRSIKGCNKTVTTFKNKEVITINKTIHIHLYSYNQIRFIRINNYLTITDKEILISIFKNLNINYNIYANGIVAQVDTPKLYDLFFALTCEEYILLID